MINEIEKTFFNPGDIVILKHGELISPVMYVVEKITQSYKHGNEITNIFKGIKCRWFDGNMVLREAVFSTKDLKFYKNK